MKHIKYTEYKVTCKKGSKVIATDYAREKDTAYWLADRLICKHGPGHLATVSVWYQSDKGLEG